MAAGKLDLLIEQGADFDHSLIVKQGKATTQAELAALPVADLTGYTARMHIRSVIESTIILIALTTENGRIAITPLDGKIDMTISAIDTAALNFEAAVYDLEIVSSGGEVTRLVQGKVRLSKEVTR
jgi:hypothetical protein